MSLDAEEAKRHEAGLRLYCFILDGQEPFGSWKVYREEGDEEKK